MKSASIRIALTAVALIGLIYGWNKGSTAVARASFEREPAVHGAEGPPSHADPAIAELQKQLQAQNERLHQLEEQDSMTARVSHDAGDSVGMIVGEYIWTDPSGRKPLRYQGVDENGEFLTDENGNELMSFDGTGPIIVREFEGTAFLIDHQTLLTSGFILSPWTSDPLLDRSENPKLMPSIRMLHAYFPGVKDALDIKIDRAAESGDAVICKTDRPVPAAGLGFGPHEKVTVGDRVVMLGYPGGVDLLSSRVPDDVRREINKYGRPNMDEAALVLAQRGYIHPIAMPTRVSGQSEERIFFETFGQDGMTGGPLMNAQGKVLAMSQAVHPNYPSFNMATTVAPLKAWVANSER